jgi:hypothetical protein
MGAKERLFYAGPRHSTGQPGTNAMPLVLYQRDDCHLCDLALAVLAEARAPDFDSLWVDDDPALEARYGERVPVLRDGGSGRELDWPFDAAAVQAFLQPL